MFKTEKEILKAKILPIYLLVIRQFLARHHLFYNILQLNALSVTYIQTIMAVLILFPTICKYKAIVTMAFLM